MKVAIDFDRTLTAEPKLIFAMVRGFMSCGFTWGVLTASVGRREQELAEMAKWGFPPPDFFVAKPAHHRAMPNVLWKASQMVALEVDILIDDLDTGRIGIYNSPAEVRSRVRLTRGRVAS